MSRVDRRPKPHVSRNGPDTGGYTSSEDYARLVAGYAKQSIGTSLFTGELFEGLSVFLSREFDHTHPVQVDVVVHTLLSTANQDGKQGVTKQELTTYSDTSELDQLRNVLALKDCDRSQFGCQDPVVIIFMQGHQPPECLTRLGAICNVNPLFFQCHLEHRWLSSPLRLFSSPLLPSA
ncbi:hypothetical protein B0O99DRAFT_694643 [Bisporella sp. PMI_857]|nr:hypothetical protein B0O99DRAFT_694643 [Bisporella sp. PMI_857]